jgi:hypothetical protein
MMLGIKVTQLLHHFKRSDKVAHLFKINCLEVHNRFIASKMKVFFFKGTDAIASTL